MRRGRGSALISKARTIEAETPITESDVLMQSTRSSQSCEESSVQQQRNSPW
jgi:hypothetical protein